MCHEFYVKITGEINSDFSPFIEKQFSNLWLYLSHRNFILNFIAKLKSESNACLVCGRCRFELRFDLLIKLVNPYIHRLF